MKNNYTACIILFITVLVLMSFSMSKQSKFYYAYAEKIYLNKLDNKLIVRYKQNKKHDKKQIRSYLGLRDEYIKWKDESTCVIISEPSKMSSIKNKILKQVDVKTINPVYATNMGLEMGVTDEILVRFNKGVSQKEIDKLHKEYNVELVKTTKIYQLLKVPNGADGLEIANKYHESGLTRFSHPNFICDVELHQTIPNDPYFINQFSLNNTGQVFADGHSGTNDSDIDAPEAWAITKGNNNIVIAVLDQGLTSDHPDLPNTRQIRLNGSNFADGDPNNPSPTFNSNHGNACAGIIGATQNNNEGIAGIASNCRIMPIRIFNADNSGITPQGLADAIGFASQNGADIISNSWGYNSDDPNLHPVIRDAIIAATTEGRNNLGCVVVFSGGNNFENDGFVHFPSNVNVTGVLTVGASDRFDQKSFYSPLANPASQNNQVIDLVAPSHRAYSNQIATETFEAWSIDTPGNAGYNPVKSSDGGNLPVIGSILPGTGLNNLSYTGRFGGTSYSCPQVAGVAALILSVNPNLTQEEVFEILTETSDEVGGYAYINGRSNELGFGRLNACGAVTEAISTTLIDGPNLVCTSGSTFGLDALSAEVPVTWTSSSNISFPSGNTGSTVVAKAYSSTSSGAGWIEAAISGACGNVTLPRKDVWVGPPSFTLSGTTILDIGMPGIAIVNYSNGDHFSQGIQNSDWSFTGPLDYVNGDAMKAHYRAGRREGGVGFIYATQTNQCGSSENRLFFEVEEPFFMLVSPNPANEYTELNFYGGDEISEYQKSSPVMVSVPMGEKTQELGEYEIQIWNERKGLVKQMKSKSKKLQIPTNNLEEGTYFLHVIVNGKVHKQQLKVQR
ncbi:hypothetical protein BZG01_06010 [Labilibaculum manganireducens]|uniref:Uncharacterized protein n=1 Tax=Labilibaculum manganireducens TaxID=1940525 RepID=A0A2N3ICA5_9BACT|nr:S8 family serine peptidase [Labilibaculum manganireducens]PKQ67919.1 hypothetical protein BZG01_06010 [Labilibaculum manganireducens]